jgi:hypothetical protein
MNNKVLCCLICIVVIIILINIIFTTYKENFDILESASSGYSDEYNYTPPKNINSIISKVDGSILNVNVLTSENNNDKTIEILVDNYGIRLCIDEASNNLLKCDSANKWLLKFVNNSGMMNEILRESSLGQSSTLINYPYYMILTTDKKLALQYNNGRFSVSPVGNYDSQKWDVSDYIIPEQQLFVKDIYDSPLDKMEYEKTTDPKDRVKINLNINDDRLKEILHVNPNNNSSNNSETCDTYVPKKAIDNLCSGGCSEYI